MHTPPKLAAAVLKRLGPGNDALAGDVLEQFREGRSRLWLWRQVFGAVLRGIVADVRSHPVLTLRGVILGFVLIYVASNAVFAALRLPEELFTRGIIRGLYLNGYAPPDWVRLFRVWPWIGLWKSVIYFCAAWIVARTHRPCALAAVFGNLLVGQVSNTLYFYTQLMLPQRSMSLEQLVVDLMLLYPLAIVAGGVMSARTTAPQRAGALGTPPEGSPREPERVRATEK